jgi:phage/plasmid-like protein (TIGR03299 family)
MHTASHHQEKEYTMGLLPEKAFTVREAAWWDHDGSFVLDYYPGRDEAMSLCGHDWDVVELGGVRYEIPNAVLAAAGQPINEAGNGVLRKSESARFHVRSDNLVELHQCKNTFASIPNRVPYDLAEAMLGEGFKFDAGITMDEGRENALTLLLNEPILISGDDSQTLPYFAVSWCHDGTGALRGRSTSVRNVCQNTVSASEAEGKRLGTDFTIRHTKNWRDYVESAREAIKGTRETISAFQEAMEELALIPISLEQRDLFISEVVGDRGGILSGNALTSDRVKNNLDAEKAKIASLFFGPTIPEAHALTGYGLHLAGVEYFDHLRAYRSKDSYVRRTLLADNPAKASLNRTIRELAVA